jgi:hypothetical protein
MNFTLAQHMLFIVLCILGFLGIATAATSYLSPTSWLSTRRVGHRRQRVPRSRRTGIPLTNMPQPRITPSPQSGRVLPSHIPTDRVLDWDERTQRYIEATTIALPKRPEPIHIPNQPTIAPPTLPTPRVAITPPTPHASLDSFRSFDSIFTGPIPSPNTHRMCRPFLPLPTLHSTASFEAAPPDDVLRSRFSDDSH